MLNKNRRVIIFALMIAVLSACNDVNQVSPTQVADMLEKKTAMIVDVREDKEWQAQHIPGVIHIPLGQLASRLNELTSYKDQPLIMQCRTGNRSQKAAAILKEQGFQQVYNLDGGIEAWKQAGLALEVVK